MGLERLLGSGMKTYLAEDLARLAESPGDTHFRLASQRVASVSEGATAGWHGDAETVQRVREQAPVIDGAWRDVMRAQGLRNVRTGADGWTTGSSINWPAVGVLAGLGTVGIGAVAGYHQLTAGRG
jgi:hypothetical protein